MRVRGLLESQAESRSSIDLVFGNLEPKSKANLTINPPKTSLVSLKTEMRTGNYYSPLQLQRSVELQELKCKTPQAGALLQNSCSHKEDENNRETTRNYKKGRKIYGYATP